MALFRKVLVANCLVLGMCLFASVASCYAQQTGTLGVVKPAVDCSALASLSLHDAVGVDVTLQAATVSTAKGPFCHVTGVIAPAIHLEVDLPVEHWTQRLLQAGCGGLCGMINASIGNAGGCELAINGEFVVAATDMGHQSQMGSPTEGSFATDPQKRIDFAYRANHLTALTAKALIHAYYGQPQKFAYFSGCSDGGREAMMEAERFPDDFDGISAGAPAMYFQVQNSLNHAWMQAVNTRQDGTKILQRAKLEALHTVVMDHCDTLDGVKDGLLTDPRACKVDAKWVECSASATGTTSCLTHEEWTAASKLYMGPTDAKGQHFLPGGWQPGSELEWAGGMFGGGPPRAPQQAGNVGPGGPGGPPNPQGGFNAPDGQGRPGGPGGQGGPGGGPGGGMVVSMAPVVFVNATPADTSISSYPFTVEQFRRATELHGLNDATNTDLRPFASRGGKLIMYHGWSDTSIAPLISVAYYTAVQRDLGAANVDHFLRLFMMPGMGHCGGGDGFPQFDTLTPLLAWVEQGKAPAMLVADRIEGRSMAGPDGRGGRTQTAPFARPNQPALSSRPIYPFPQIAHPVGSAAANAADFVAAPSDVSGPVTQSWVGSDLLTMKAPVFYSVVDGKLHQQ